ncbi:SDR family oxidoreductase [Paracoccus methylovorus]|uniref:SDR family oxidoreductase n=1 Tax=Paracoccus methylovorus TaxID=2812658 RepID=A0ABX7JMH0_9RHOB|nr:SDR family NAD(P)-dependent oxidoreductase [Paracoccus methylovorus]QRZ15141.1 SDR family oxidoreductase [Paracoccus methylovorus]
MTRKTVFVTGAAQGIGEAIAARLAAEGWRSVLIDRNTDAVEAAAGRLSAQGLDIRAAALDVTDAAAVADCIAAEARVDAVVTAAGIYSDRDLFALTADDFRAMTEVNLIGTFLIAQAGARRMGPGGRIVTISSRGALGGRRFAHYAASKAAVIGLTRAMAMELRERQITVNSVAPGFTDTPMTRSAPAELFAEWEGLEARGKAASPDEIAAAVSFFLGEDANFITGQCLFVDGGKSLGGSGL